MKTSVTPAIVTLKQDDLKAFRAVNETLATEFLQAAPANKRFSAVSLWKLRKQSRTAGLRIR